MAGALDPLVAPLALDLLAGVRHRRLGQVVVAAAPDPERRASSPAGTPAAPAAAAPVPVGAVPVERLRSARPGARSRRCTARRRRGRAATRAAAASRRAASSCSATPSNWNSSMYQDFSRCSTVGVGRARGDGRPRARRAARPDRARTPRAPSHRGAPVVPDDLGALDAERIQHGDHVGDAVADARSRRPPRGRSDSPKPRRSGAMTRLPAATSAGTWCRHSRWESGKPWISRTGCPSPSSWTVSVTPSVSISRSIRRGRRSAAPTSSIASRVLGVAAIQRQKPWMTPS